MKLSQMCVVIGADSNQQGDRLGSNSANNATCYASMGLGSTLYLVLPGQIHVSQIFPSKSLKLLWPRVPTE